LLALARWEDRRLAPSDSLVRMVQHRDAHVRRAAARTAGLIGRDDILPELLGALDDPSGTVRAEVAFALGLLGSERAVPALSAALEGPYRRLRLAALEGLAHLPHNGEALVIPALQGDEQEALRAWNGLRNRAEAMDHARLVATIQAGLSRAEDEVLWRVLRCAERAPDSTLVPQLAPFALSVDAQVRVHACRALARQKGLAALEAVLTSCEDETDFSAREGIRIKIAQLRALGRLAPQALQGQSGEDIDTAAFRIAAQLTGGAHDISPHVARTALSAMAQAVSELFLPREASHRESLLPVWRIRLARAARERLDDPIPAVRAAAVNAYVALRGAGALAVWQEALADSSVLVQEAALAAMAAQASNPSDCLTAAKPYLYRPRGRMRAAAATALFAFWERRDQVLAPADTSSRTLITQEVLNSLVQAVADSDFVVVATAAPLLGHFPSTQALSRLLLAYDYAGSYDRAGGEGRADIRLAVLDGMATFFARDRERGGEIAEHQRLASAGRLQRAFDSPDLRIRLKGREVAESTGLLSPDLIPSEPSLRATLPAHVRSPAQPPVALPAAAPRVRCQTDRGEFVIALDGKLAPNTVAAFLHLIREGFYDDLTFHRVVPDFVIQGGDPRGDGWGGPGYSIRSEWGRQPYERGTVGIAHAGKDSGGSQFFVTLSPQPHLNGRYTVFGRVIEGMATVDRIQPGESFRLLIDGE
jgi:cyclophilin family peptidyl-prolyl cis-trans isomerase/HEAT repeat protein